MDATQQVQRSSWPEKSMVLDNVKAKIVSTIEWFDDRVYKVLLPPDFDPKRWEFFWSVTTILGIISKPWLTVWFGNLGTERARYQSNRAKDRGSLIHNAIAELLNFDDDGLGKPLDGAEFKQEDWLPICNFAQWYRNTQPKVIYSDRPVVSYQYKYAGTLDLLATFRGGLIDNGMSKQLSINGGTYVLDIKTGQESDDYHYQTSAYYQAVVEEGIVGEVAGTMILYLDASTKGGYKLVVREKEQAERDFQTFLNAKALFDAKGQKLPEVFEMPLGIRLERMVW